MPLYTLPKTERLAKVFKASWGFGSEPYKWTWFSNDMILVTTPNGTLNTKNPF